MALWGNNDSKTATGTVAIAANGLVTGTSTLLDTEARVGDYIRANGDDFLIQSITANTTAQVIAGTVGATIAAVGAGNTYTLSEKPKSVTTAEAISATHGNPEYVFGVDATEAGIKAGTIVSIEVTSPGTGYTANATVTISGGGGSSGAANAQSNSIGRIAAVNITNAGTSYESSPTVAIAAPASVSFNAASAVSNTDDTITISSAPTFAVGDRVTYAVAAGNTAVDGLTSGQTYFVSFANSTVLAVAATGGGANIDLTSGSSETGHTLTGATATATATVGGAQGVQHAGWVRRTVGTGGRAGRVQYETLVAMGTIAGDQSDDSELPDS